MPFDAVKSTSLFNYFTCLCGGRSGFCPGPPVAGTPLICIECGRLHVVDGDGSIRRMAAEEIRLVETTPELRQWCVWAWQMIGLPQERKLYH